ncbi:glycosyl hydrolase catalytic core-domain-containing protein [Biscogniauxia marginata]|nr:glycosyl hydrolase catalytic core-domain-containing protein [Biscogniauxia marginata]
MSLFQITKSVASLAACILLSSPVQALPVETQALAQRNPASSKRIAMWDYRNSRDIQTNGYPNLRATAASLAGSHFTMASDWDTLLPPELPDSVLFVPQVRTLEHLSGDHWNNLLNVVAKQGSNTVVQYVNEPDFNGISVDAALQHWGQLVQLRVEKGVKITSPALTSDPNRAHWLREFMSRLSPEQKPDFVATHFYTTQGQPCESEMAWGKDYMQKLHAEYQLPLWVNEIASTSRDQAEVNQFVNEMSAWMDAQPWIAAYGFTGMSREVADDFSSPASLLLTSDGSWSPLGQLLHG